MPNPRNGLTLQKLAEILRDHMDGTAARFAEVAVKIDELRREVSGVAGMVRDLSQVVLRQVDEVAEHRRELEEHRQYIRQTFVRMEQSDARFGEVNREFRARTAEHDARFESMSRDIRRILDALERRGGDGGGRQP